MRPWRSPGHRDGATRGCLGDRLFVRPARPGPQPSHRDGIPEAEPSTLPRSSRRSPSMRKRTQVPRLGPVYPTPATVTPTYADVHRPEVRGLDTVIGGGVGRASALSAVNGARGEVAPRSANPTTSRAPQPIPTPRERPRQPPRLRRDRILAGIVQPPGLGLGAGSSFRRGVCGGLRRRPRLTTRRPPRDRRPMPSAGR